jgi:putative PIN family toxin of toxin-antitoxin system
MAKYCNIACDMQYSAMRLVVDTSVMVAAIRSNLGASNRILEACLLERVEMLVSVPLMMEYEAVMSRSEHLKAARLERADIERLLDDVAAVLVPVRLAFLWRPNLPDPNDDMVLETAMNGGADVLVTFNIRDFLPFAERFGIEVLLPSEFVRRREWTK